MNYILKKGDQEIFLDNSTLLTLSELRSIALKKFSLKPQSFTLSYVDLENDHINIQDDDDLEVCVHEFNETSTVNQPIVIVITDENSGQKVMKLEDSPRLMSRKKSIEFQLVKSVSDIQSVKSEECEKLLKDEKEEVVTEVDATFFATQPLPAVEKEEKESKNDFDLLESQISNSVLSNLDSKIEESISKHMDALLQKKFDQMAETKRKEKENKKKKRLEKAKLEAEERKEKKRLEREKKKKKEKEYNEVMDSVKKLIEKKTEKEEKKEEKTEKKKEKSVPKEERKRKKSITAKPVQKTKTPEKKIEKPEEPVIKTMKDIQAESLNKLESLLTETAPSTSNKTEKKPEVAPIQPMKHYHIICDGCNVANFEGDRHKCTQCDDYDLCGKCHSEGIHKEHALVKFDRDNKYQTYCHQRVICDGCGKNPIFGTRFKCYECPDFNLCQECEKTMHKHHIMLRIPEEKNLYNLLNGKNENVLELQIGNIMPPKNSPFGDVNNCASIPQIFKAVCNNNQTRAQKCGRPKKCHRKNVMPCHIVKAAEKKQEEVSSKSNPEVKEEKKEEIKPEIKVETRIETEIYEEPEMKNDLSTEECIFSSSTNVPETDKVIIDVQPEKIEENTEEKIEENTNTETQEPPKLSDILSQ